ncbi:hypothetical protein IWX64_002175 [Arthrobacter sp. CAN_A212]
MDRVLAATGERLPPQWALQVPSDYVDVLRTAVPEAVRAAGIDPGTLSDRHRLHRLHHGHDDDDDDDGGTPAQRTSRS